jgi:septum formation protein
MSPFPTDGEPWVYLASGSPQRRAILEELGISYQLLSVDAEEIVAATPCETVEENAGRKLLAGLRSGGQGLVVIAADTVLEAQGRLLGKPADEATATEYLQILSGGSAVAYSAVAVGVAGEPEGCVATETAEVRFKTLSPETIRWYLSTGEPSGRAGAFGIGRLGEVLTESVTGSHSCVSGLPKTALLAALARVAGSRMPQWLRSMPQAIVGTRIPLRSLRLPPARSSHKP